MRIFCLIQCSNLGGMEKVTLDSLSLLQEEGHEVTLFSLHQLGDLKKLADERGIPISGTEGYKWGGIGNVPAVMKAMKAFRPDRLWMVGHNFGSLLVARKSGVPAYMSLHYHHCERPLRFWKLFYGAARRTCKKLHFVSHYIFSEVASLFPSQENVVSFPNMLKAPAKRPEKSDAQQSMGIPPDSFVIGNAGWLIHRKAFDVFLDTASIIAKSIPEACFILAGDGEERGMLEEKAEELGIKDRVIFLGWVSDLEPFYAALDLLLFNSRYDCLPTTPLEAMVRGIPVVCSLSHGGLSEVLRHGPDGFLISEQDPEALAAEVIRLHRDSDVRDNTAQQGRKQVEKECSPEQHLNHLKSYLELI